MPRFVMLSLEKVRKIDPSLADLSDEKLKEVIQKLYDLGQLVFEQWLDDTFGSKRPPGLLANGQNQHKIKP